MSSSKEKPKLTKAGVALTAEARKKLRQVAKWLEYEEQRRKVGAEPLRPAVVFGWINGIANSMNVTIVSFEGALVQMFDPFTLSEARMLHHNLYRVDPASVRRRFASILGTSEMESQKLVNFITRTAFSAGALAINIRKL